MPFDWSKFQELAEALRQSEDEAARRTSISRLYYAVYWQARLYLTSQQNFTLSQYEGSHKQVWREYKRHGTTHKGVGTWGDRLHENRLKADYEAEIPRLYDLLNDSFNIAQKVQFYLGQIQRATQSE